MNFRLVRSGIRLSIILVVALGLSAPAQSGLILGGSTLLTPSYVTNLEGWLGEGQLTLTNIFTKTVGSTSLDFHSAADGQGRTFTVMRATDDGVTAIVGGYNPQSWNSTSGWNYTYSVAEQTAFVFNLSNGGVFRQHQCCEGGNLGYTQTYNAPNYGPTFGYAYDLWINGNLDDAYSFLYSYSKADTSDVSLSIVSGVPWDGNTFSAVGEIEVFAIGQMHAEVPEPTTIALIGMALLSMFGFGMMRRRADV